jgi:endonuclease/exonuclease/phosphatase family metal-dependent hydrolase
MRARRLGTTLLSWLPAITAGALLLLTATTAASAAELKIATWNLDWLTTRQPGQRGMPTDVRARQPEDFARLAHYAAELNADVIAIQEVDGRDAAMRVFPREHYSIHMTRDRLTQRVGIAVRRGIPYSVNPDVTSLAVEPRLRSGADITLHLAGGELRILAVHLKRGCRDVKLARSISPACSDLRSQITPLSEWIAARSAAGEAFLVLGDFNRTMDGRDQFWGMLRQAAPLTRATEGRASPCWGGEAFIDHILAGGPARTWVRPEMLRVLLYRETGPEWKDRLSDHCPVSVRLSLPDGHENAP